MKKHKKKKKDGFYKQLLGEIKENKSTFIVYLVLRTFVLGALIWSAICGNYENVLLCALSLVLFLLPAFLEKQLRIQLPSVLEIIILLFIFSAEMLGELSNFYINVPFWDSMLHTINGFLCAAIGFALVDIINRNKRFKFQLSPFFLALVAFCFSMTVGVLWEFFEFGCDMLFHLDMQKDTVIHHISSVALDPTNSNHTVIINGIESVIVNGEDLGLGGYLDIGLIDTMKDLLVNFIGAVVFSVIGFFFVKSRGKGKFARFFIPILDDEAETVKATDTASKTQQDSSKD